MKWFSNMKISAKLIITFLLVALISGVIGVVGIVNLRSINSNDTALYEKQTVPISKLAYLSTAFQMTRVDLRDAINAQTSDGANQYIDKIKLRSAPIDTASNELGKLIVSDKMKNEFITFKNTRAIYETYAQKLIILAQGNKDAEAQQLLSGDALKAATDLEDSLGRMNKIIVAEAKTKSDNNSRESDKATLVIILFMIGGMGLAIIFGLYLSKKIARPLSNLNEAANLISQGDLNVNIKIDSEDEIGTLGRAFEKILSALKNLVEDSNKLTLEAMEGNLLTRADSNRHSGEYRVIVEGVNKTLDAITEPINESRTVLSKMALNDLTLSMTGSYKGMMKEFAEDINSVHTRVSNVVKVVKKVSLGDTSSIEDYIAIGKRCENDELMPSILLMMNNIRNLVAEVSTIADHAIEGDLEFRGDPLKFQGGYREVLQGFNKALDAVEEPIKEAEQVLREMADGNLSVLMNGSYLGSYKAIKDSLNYALDSFNDLLGNITDASNQVLSGANQVSDGSQALSQGTTEQASSIEELTSSITEVAAQTKQNAVNASQANVLALDAKEGAIQGNSHMKEMLKSMEEINESSSNISKIIKVIDDIAFQTNILALNAAVEAARAGQHGKGFAVVAEEVRNLAARSADAAKETTDLIEGSIKKVELGTKIANNTADALNQIVDGVSNAATLVGEIAAASNEQATAISQINKGIEQVSDVVQTNSATAEESAAASEELSSQAEMLKNMVGKFRLKRSGSISSNEDNFLTQNKSSKGICRNSSNNEIGGTKNRPRISLSDKEFGKY